MDSDSKQRVAEDLSSRFSDTVEVLAHDLEPLIRHHSFETVDEALQVMFDQFQKRYLQSKGMSMMSSDELLQGVELYLDMRNNRLAIHAKDVLDIHNFYRELKSDYT